MAFMPQGTRNIERKAILRTGEYVAFVVEQGARSMVGGVKDTYQKPRSLLDFAPLCRPSATLPKEQGLMRVASRWAPDRPQRGPYTGRGARTVGLLNDRTRGGTRSSA